MKTMKQFLSLCATVMALGLPAVAHADITLVSGDNKLPGTKVLSMNVTGDGLGPVGVNPFVVLPPYPNSYSTLPGGAQWVSPLLDLGQLIALPASPNKDYTFTKTFSTSTPGIISVQGQLLSDNNLVSATVDGNPILVMPGAPGYDDPTSFTSYQIPRVFGPTAGTAGTAGNSHTLVFVVHNQDIGGYNPVALDFLVNVKEALVVGGCDVAQSSLWPPNHNLVNVFLSNPTVSGGVGPPYIEAVTVLSNEADQPSGASGDDHFSPDAKNQTPNANNGEVDTLRLRAERLGTGSGRVYLIIVNETDANGHTGICTSTVVVPHDQSAASVAAVTLAATNAAASYEFSGVPPSGYVVVGTGPINGPKQ